MGKKPAFLFYASDFLVDTAEWTAQEVGVYIRLLSQQWVNGSIPMDQKRISLIEPETKEVWNTIKHKFIEIDGRLVNNKLEQIRDDMKKQSMRSSEKASKAAKARWNKDASSNAPSIPSSNAKAMPLKEGEGESIEKGVQGEKEKDPRPIKKIMEWLESEIGGMLDGSIYDNEVNCLDCLEKIEKDFPNDRAADLLFWWIESALQDDFHKKNLTNFKYIFKNLGKLRLCHEAMEQNNE